MQDHPAGIKVIGGHEFQLYVDDEGNWSATAKGFATTRSHARDRLLQNLKVKVSQAKVRVEIPFTEITGSEMHTGIATGIDTRSGGVTVKWPSGDRNVLSRASTGGLPGRYLGELSGEQRSELLAILGALQGARLRLSAFQAEHAIDLHDTVTRAVIEKIEAQ